MQQMKITSSCRATYLTKHTRKSNSHKFSLKLTLVISLILLSTLIEAVPIPSSLNKRDVSNDDLKTFVNFASAAYCDSSTFSNWDCGPNCDATDGTVVSKFFTTSKTNTQAFIATYEKEELIVVSFRGTVPENVKNIITDAKFVLGDYPPAIKNKAKVHVGFYKAFLDAQFDVFDEVQRLHKEHPNFKVLYTGHSLGAALTLLSALDLVQNSTDFVANENLFVVTYGEPRVGNSNFAKYVDSKLKVLRVVNGGDIVPRLPPRINGYKHHSDELWISNPDKSSSDFTKCNSGEDLHCSISVPIFDLSTSFHDGPYFGITIGCDSNNEESFTALTKGLGGNMNNSDF